MSDQRPKSGDPRPRIEAFLDDFIEKLHRRDIVLDKDADTIGLAEGSEESTLALLLGKGIAHYQTSKSFSDQSHSEAAIECLYLVELAYSHGVVNNGQNMAKRAEESEARCRDLQAELKTNEAERLKLKQDLEVTSKERDAWKKRYADCESAKFGTGTETGEVEDSP